MGEEGSWDQHTSAILGIVGLVGATAVGGGLGARIVDASVAGGMSSQAPLSLLFSYLCL